MIHLTDIYQNVHLRTLKIAVYSGIRNENSEAPNYHKETQSTLTVQHGSDITRMSSKLRSLMLETLTVTHKGVQEF